MTLECLWYLWCENVQNYQWVDVVANLYCLMAVAFLWWFCMLLCDAKVICGLMLRQITSLALLYGSLQIMRGNDDQWNQKKHLSHESIKHPKTKCKSRKTIKEFHVKTSLSAKNKLDPARNENWPKKQYTAFQQESLQFMSSATHI